VGFRKARIKVAPVPVWGHALPNIEENIYIDAEERNTVLLKVGV